MFTFKLIGCFSYTYGCSPHSSSLALSDPSHKPGEIQILNHFWRNPIRQSHIKLLTQDHYTYILLLSGYALEV